MAVNTNSETTNNTSETETAATKECNLNIEYYICKDMWKEIINEFESMKDFLMEVVENHSKVVNDVLHRLKIKNKEAKRT